MQMYLDRVKAEKLLSEELKNEKIDEAVLVLEGDAFWNSECIYKNGKRYKQKDFKCYYTSHWATPTIVFHYEDGKEKRIPCFFRENEEPKRLEKIRKTEKVEFDKLMKSANNLIK